MARTMYMHEIDQENRKRKDFWWPVVGTAFGVAVLLVVALLSPFGCWLLPPKVNAKYVLLFHEPNTLFFKAEGFHPCFLTVDGMFPAWFEAVRVKFPNRDNFLSLKNTTYVFPKDFEVAKSDGVISGFITVDRDSEMATVALQFDDQHSYNDVINGRYDLSKPRPAIPIPEVAK
jgi:hypothetical protein